MSNGLKTVLISLLHLALMRIRYPFWSKRIAHFSEPNIAHGLSDHPLDRHDEPLIPIFNIF